MRINRFYDMPLADKGLTSYRYRGTFGWIMIAARDEDDALREAARSTNARIVRDNLEVWDSTAKTYKPVA